MLKTNKYLVYEFDFVHMTPLLIACKFGHYDMV